MKITSKHSFTSVLRAPDNAFGATEKSVFRFEEPKSAACDVEYKYEIGKNSAKVTVFPSGSPVKYLKLRFRHDMRGIDRVYGDQWERSGDNAFLEWHSVMPGRLLPWFCYVMAGDKMACYGVKTGADCFASWQVDNNGITLFLNLMSGNCGTDIKEPLLVCEVVELFGNEGEDPFKVAKRFSSLMCENPKLPREPIFGVNNWYWAYGKISRESVMRETDYLLEMCDGAKHRPYMIIDDGWQMNRTYDVGAYIGGPWIPNERFGSMAETVEQIHTKGAKAGIWFRPLLTLGDVPAEAKLAPFSGGGVVLDPTHPYTLERIERDAGTIRSWGFELIKHDFSTIDMFGVSPLTSERQTYNMFAANRNFYDKSITSATAVKRMYEAIARGCGDADVIACNAIGHLTAGIHSVYRTGNDTSGRSFEWTRHALNTMMRLPLNDSFYKADPDCAAFTDRVDTDINLDFLEMCALSGVTTLASVTPGILTDREMARINKIFLTADADNCRYEIRDYEKTAVPDSFCDPCGGGERIFDWERVYDGSRIVYEWFN